MKPPTLDKACNLELRLLESGATFSVAEFHVVQGLSTPFEVVLIVRGGVDFCLESTIGQLARFDAWAAGRGELPSDAPKSWTGYVVSVEDVGGDAKGHRLFKIHVASKLWALSQNRNYRVFQEASELSIACQILDEWNIPYELEVDEAKYKPLKYRVQYRESDLHFLQRNLESVGISYLLVSVDGEETVIFTDEPQRDEPRASLTFIDGAPQFGAINWARDVSVMRKARPGRYVLQELDYRRSPTQAIRIGAQSQSVSMLEQCLERFHYVPGNCTRIGDAESDTPVADDRSIARVDQPFGEFIARLRLEAKQVDRWRVRFETNALDLYPGVVVPITNHDRPELAVPLLVLSTTFEGSDIGVWRMRCEAVPANVPYRPPLDTERPRSTGLESATVVGPDGSEIHTDEFGRVRVQFHWDRAGQRDEKSSCWIPVSQSWSGAAYGTVHLPRVGQEVLIDFLSGDVDKPIVVGRVYTKVQPVPYKLPENKTITVVCRTQTVGGDGYNEIMAEDAAGKQLLGFQAERDLKMLVKNDEHVHVRHDMTECVDNDRTSIVGGTWNFDALPPIPKANKPSKGKVPRSGLTWNHGNLNVKIGACDLSISHTAIGLSVGATSITLEAGKISLDTGGGARIVLNGGSIEVIASSVVDVVGHGTVNISSGGVVDVKGQPIKLNC